MSYLRRALEGGAFGSGLAVGAVLGWNVAEAAIREASRREHRSALDGRQDAVQVAGEQAEDREGEQGAGDVGHGADHSGTPVADVTCGAQEWAWGDRLYEVIVYGTCGLPAGHGVASGSWWHREVRGGRLWCEWRGDPAERAPHPLALPLVP